MGKEQTSVVEINVNKQIYKISCEEGQEEHIQNLAKFINNELEKLVSSVGQIGEARLLLMTCLIIADKLKMKVLYLIALTMTFCLKHSKNYS